MEYIKTINGQQIALHKKHYTPWMVTARVLLYVFLIVLGIVLLLPYFVMLLTAVMTPERYNLNELFPDKIVLANFINAFNTGGGGGYLIPLLNSVWVYVLNSVLAACSSVLAAYAFARLKWIGKNFVFAIMMGTMMVPAIVTQIPLYVMYNSFGLTETFWPLFISSIFYGGAPNVFLTRQFMVSCPKEMFEAAEIDGAGPFGRLFYIALPLSKTIFIYLIITTFLAGWGDYVTPSIYIRSAEYSDVSKMTFALMLFRSLGTEGAAASREHPEYLYAACTIMTLIPAVLYAIFQNYLVQGVATAGLKD